MRRFFIPLQWMLTVCLMLSVLPATPPPARAAAATQLDLVVSAANPFAEEYISVTVTARDAAGAVDIGYRGAVRFSSTGAFAGLPVGGLGGDPYTFTEADAGTRTWTNVRLRQSGSQTLTVSDGTLQQTIPVEVKPVQLVLAPSVSTIFADEVFAGITVRAEDGAGNLVPGYRGVVTFNSDSAFVGLPVGGLGGDPYTFTEVDAGTRTWTEARLRASGNRTLTVGDGYRQASAPITVNPVFFNLAVAPTTVFPGQPAITATLRIQDSAGNLVPGYRGAVTFNSNSQFNGLPVGGLGGNPYAFTAADAGQRAWGQVSLSTPGTRVLTATDGFRTGQSNPVLVQALDFRITFSPTQSIVNDRTLTMTVEAIDQDGNLVPSYRGDVDLNASVPTIGLPQSTFNATPDYTFTEQDAGRHVFTEVAFTAQGNQTVTVVDRSNATIAETSAPVAVGLPPDPQPVVAIPAPAPVPLPPSLALPPPMLYGWGQPFVAQAAGEPANYWLGKPDYPVPANPGTFYVMTGSSRRSPGAWWAGSAYVCPKMGWESVLRADRREGVGLTAGDQDPTFMPNAPGLSMCGPLSDSGNNGQIVHFEPFLSRPAPIGAQGVHVNPEARGNESNDYSLGFNAASDELECDGANESPQVGDPVDVRSGAFHLEERDIGVATGCANMSLSFARTYRQGAPSTGSLGPGWVHNFETRVTTDGAGYAMVQRPRGSFLVFQDVGGEVYASRADSPWTLLKRSGGGWTLVSRDRRAEVYDARGRLVALQDANGNQMWMTYETVTRNGATTRLARVDAPGGRFLWFGYDYYRPWRITVVGDNANRRMRFGYNDSQPNNFVDDGALVSATDATGAVSAYTYSPNNLQLLKKTDALGRDVFVNSYDAGGRVTRQQLNTGQDLRLSYQVITDTAEIRNRLGAEEAQGLHALLVTSAQDQAGSASYTFGSDGLLRSMTDPAGATMRYQQYTASRKPGRIIDALGRTTRLAYNERGQATQVTDALNGVTQLAYDDWGLTTAITNTLGQATRFSYDGPNLTRITDALGQTSVISYTAQAGWQNVLSGITNAEGATTSLSYNVAGDITSITDALGGIIRMEYDTIGRPIAVTDARGNTTSYRYDAADRLLQVTDPLSGSMQITYDAVGNPIRMTDQVSSTTLITYTPGNQPLAMQDAQGGVTRITYDASGRPTIYTNPLGHTTTLTYDSAGRVVAATDALGATTRRGYDALGNTTVITDANGHALRMAYDALNRLTEVRNAAGQFLQYGYDAVGNTTVLTNTLGHTAAVQYDARHRPIQYTDPEGRTTTLSYTPLDQLAAVTDGNGRVTGYRYDPLGRLSAVIANDQPALPDGVDVNVRTRYSYDAVGNLTTLTDPRGFVTSFSYDARNRMTSMTDPPNRVSRYVYDARSLLTRWEQADGTVVTYGYDALGRRTSVTAPDASSTTRYDAAGRTIELTDATGTTSIQYDAASRPLTVTLSLGGTVSYRYDGVGNRTRVMYLDGKTVQYAYTPANQLGQVTDWSGGITGMQYDGAGRLTSVSRPNGTSTTVSYDRSGLPTRIDHGGADVWTYTYDGSGRRVGAVEGSRVLTYTYDGLYRLTAANASQGTSYAYR